jgi:transposase-like protein
MSQQMLTTEELSQRWSIAQNTLRKWRVAGGGPAYIKLGPGRNAEVRYSIDDIIEFENENKFCQTLD